MVPPRGVGGPAPIFALAIFRPFLIEPLLTRDFLVMLAQNIFVENFIPEKVYGQVKSSGDSL